MRIPADRNPPAPATRVTSVGRIVLDHVAFGVAEIDPAAAAFMRTTGAQPYMSGPGAEFRGAQVRAAGGAVIEFIEPVVPSGGFLGRFLRAGGPRIHHVTFKVGNIEIARDVLRDAGYTIVGFSDAVPGWKEMFLHPKEAMGIVVQIAEADPSLDDGWSGDWPYRVANAPGNPVSVRGVRMKAANLETAKRQWGDLLGGSCKEDAGLYVFEWSDSPLRIAVQCEGESRDGAVGIEVAGTVATSREFAELLGAPLLSI